MTRRAVLGLTLWIAAAGVGAATSGSTAGAAPPDAVAWWHRPILDAAAGTVALPDLARQPLVPVPPGGLYVANDASGPRAAAAARFAAVDGSGAVLSLRVAGDALLPVGAALVACSVASTWQPLENGGWDERPELDCGVAVPGQFVDDRSGVRFDIADISPFVTSRGIEVGLVPASGEVATFAIAFEPPASDSLTPTPTPTPTPTTTTTQPTVQPATTAADRESAPAAPGAPRPGGNQTVASTPAQGEAAAALPAAPQRTSSGSLVRIGTDGPARAGMTAALALAAAGAWFLSGRTPRTEESRP